jgi:hypothetical protein
MLALTAGSQLVELLKPSKTTYNQRADERDRIADEQLCEIWSIVVIESISVAGPRSMRVSSRMGTIGRAKHRSRRMPSRSVGVMSWHLPPSAPRRAGRRLRAAAEWAGDLLSAALHVPDADRISVLMGRCGAVRSAAFGRQGRHVSASDTMQCGPENEPCHGRGQTGRRARVLGLYDDELRSRAQNRSYLL